tara:strand:- start:929 stop:1051 length:123 start_codon:yes stop_codon:yes gene_type:complete
MVTDFLIFYLVVANSFAKIPFKKYFLKNTLAEESLLNLNG